MPDIVFEPLSVRSDLFSDIPLLNPGVSRYSETYAVPYDAGQNAKHAFAYENAQWESYLPRRDHQAGVLSRPSTAQANPRIEGWNKLVQELQQLGNSREEMLFKVEMVNGWVNTAIKYDDDKAKEGQKGGARHTDENWYATPQDTLMSGKGVCTDVALLKYETLRKIGFKDEDLRLVSGATYDIQKKQGRHMVTSVNINGSTLVMNDNMGGGTTTDVTPQSSKISIFKSDAQVEPDGLFANGKIDSKVKDGKLYRSASRATPWDFVPEFTANETYGVRSTRRPENLFSAGISFHSDLIDQAHKIEGGASVGEKKFGKDKAEALMLDAHRLNPDYVPFPSAASVPVKSEALPPVNPQGSPRKGNHRGALQGKVERHAPVNKSISVGQSKQSAQPLRQPTFDHSL